MRATSTEISKCNSVEEVMEAAKLNFIPEQHSIITGSGIECPKHKAIIRSDNHEVLSIMGKGYEPFSPVSALAVADVLRSQYDLKFSRAIGIDNGRRIIIEARSDTPIKIGPNPLDYVLKQVHVATSFDGTLPTVAEASLMRPLCNNLEIWKNKEVQAVKVRHTKNSQGKLKEAMRIWSGMNNAWEAFINKARMLTEKIVGVNEVERFLDAIVCKVEKETSKRKLNQREDLERLFHSGRGNQGKTGWDLYNAVTQYYDHETITEQPEKRLASSIYGTGAAQKTKAMNVALSL